MLRRVHCGSKQDGTVIRHFSKEKSIILYSLIYSASLKIKACYYNSVLQEIFIGP